LGSSNTTNESVIDATYVRGVFVVCPLWLDDLFRLMLDAIGNRVVFIKTDWGRQAERFSTNREWKRCTDPS
jgi:hypothetical protein